MNYKLRVCIIGGFAYICGKNYVIYRTSTIEYDDASDENYRDNA